jgi:hypothetical protein
MASQWSAWKRVGDDPVSEEGRNHTNLTELLVLALQIQANEQLSDSFVVEPAHGELQPPCSSFMDRAFVGNYHLTTDDPRILRRLPG